MVPDIFRSSVRISVLATAIIASTSVSFAEKQNVCTVESATGEIGAQTLAKSAQRSETTRPLLEDSEINALNTFQHELTICAAYYSVVETCAPPARKQEAAKTAGVIASELTMIMGVIGLRIGMTKDAITARLRLAFARITDNKVCLNFDSLIIRRANRCRQLYENPDAIVEGISRITPKIGIGN